MGDYISSGGEEDHNEDDDHNDNDDEDGEMEVQLVEANENEEESEEEEQQFDISLAASHSYMGPGLVPVSGRSVLEAGWEGRVPVIAHHGTVFPGETVPMLLINAHDATILERVIKEDKLFGLLCPDETGTLVSGYGVLCEVFEVTPPEEVPRPLTFKARAICRFRFTDIPKNSLPIGVYSRMRWAAVRVLPEVRRGCPLRAARLASLDALRASHAPHSRVWRRVRALDAVGTGWPVFVFDAVDYRRLRQVIVDYFHSISLARVPEEAVSLSFWTASNLALSARDRLALFKVDDALLRLHMEVRFITRKSILCCAACGVEIARREHIFAMSSEGVHSNYANLGGFVHDVVTVSAVMNTVARGAPSAAFSWFPGYLWTVATCDCCQAHVGWRFDAQKRNLRPRQFYGLCRNYVTPRTEGSLADADEEEAEAEARAGAGEGAGAGAGAGVARGRALAGSMRMARSALVALIRAPLRDLDPDPDPDPDPNPNPTPP